jgi:anti-sigma factor RsiW
MNASVHPIEKEELMAYLDGELTAERAATVAGHLEECAECRAWAAELRAQSDRLLSWQVGAVPPSITKRVTDAMAQAEPKPHVAAEPFPVVSRPRIFRLPRWAWATAGVVCALLVLAMTIPMIFRPRMEANLGVRHKLVRVQEEYKAAQDVAVAPELSPVGVAGGVPGGVVAGTIGSLATGAGGAGGAENPPVAVPMIARTAALTLVTNDFEKTRDALEGVVRRHRGYSAQLTVGSESGSAHTLSASFRVPADQLDATLAEIKHLARVEKEAQGGEEVTDQYVDLTARLSNARRTEQTLLDVLEKRTGKLSDVLAVEQELARVREEIERMQAELKNLQNRVTFATLQVELREEYKAELEIPPSVGRRLWNSLADGFRTTADSVVGVAMFLLNVGPVLLLWVLVLFWPVRYAWRRVRAARSNGISRPGISG